MKGSKIFARASSRGYRTFFFIALCVTLVVLHLLYRSPYLQFITRSEKDDPLVLWNAVDCAHQNVGHITERPGTQALIVASTKSEDTSWLDKFTPNFERYTYQVDDPNSNLNVSLNKGREAMPYLTYLIDHYYRLPEVMVFLHASRYQWHNEDPFYDGVPMLEKLRLDRVRAVGYSSLRCTWEVGCPAATPSGRMISRLEAALQPWNSRANAEACFDTAFAELFPEQASTFKGGRVELGSPCCAQFAVTATQVRQRSRCEYQRYRDWLQQTLLPDGVSGRVFESTWHIIFGQPVINCPNTESCFCEQYGLCNLNCSEGSCEGRWKIRHPF